MKEEITLKEKELRELLNERDTLKKQKERLEMNYKSKQETIDKLRKDKEELENKFKEKHKKEFCWNCVNDLFITEFDLKRTDFHKGICNHCIERQDNALKNAGLKVVEKNREPHFSGWYGRNVTITDVFLIDSNNKKIFIRGYKKGESPHDTKVFNWINQFLKNKGNYISDYGGQSPFTLLAYMQKNKYHFQEPHNDGSPFCSLVYHKKIGIWKFDGNLREISNAFSFRIYNKNYAELLAKCLKGIKNIHVNLKGDK